MESDNGHISIRVKFQIIISHTLFDQIAVIKSKNAQNFILERLAKGKKVGTIASDQEESWNTL